MSAAWSKSSARWIATRLVPAPVCGETFILMGVVVVVRLLGLTVVFVVSPAASRGGAGKVV